MHGAPGAVVPPVVWGAARTCVIVGKDTACAAGTLLYVGIDGLIPGASSPTRAAIRTRAARIWCITGPWWIVMGIALVPTAEGGNMQRHKRPARQQVRCVLFIHTNGSDSRWAPGCTTSSQRLRWLSSQPPPCGWVNLTLLFTADHRPLRDKQHYDAVCRPKVRVPRSSAAIGRAGIALAP
jgi:hypothetical protein